MFLLINGVLIARDEVQTARTTDKNHVAGEGCTVWFKRGGWATIPDLTVEQFFDILDNTAK